MALNGEDKEMRISCSLGYNPIENQDQIHHLQHQDEMIQQDKASPPNIHGGATATTALNSSRSKPRAAAAAAPSGAARSGTATTRYRECLKNHAANIGGNVTDGCGEFMPCGEDGTIEALKCAACNCHRNFHRKEIRSDAIVVHPFQLTPPPFLSPNMNHRRTSMVQPAKMAFAGAGGGSGSVATDSSSEDLNFNVYQSNNAVGAPPPPPFILSKKRSRTKFTQEQKDKMLEFAEKVGWRIPREDDIEVQRFCAEVGVKRQVFKVWMHNNKNLSAKKNPQE